MRIAHWIGGLSLLATAQPALADVMIIGARGPSAAMFRLGAKLKDNAVVMLKAGDQLRILDAKGVKLFKGPGKINLAMNSPTKSVLTTALSLTQVRNRNVTPAVVRRSPAPAGKRGATETLTRQSGDALRTVLLDRDGRQCLADTNNVDRKSVV